MSHQAPRAVWRHPLPLGLALAVLVLAGTLAWTATRGPIAPPREPQFLSLMLPPDQELVPGGVDLSPDGRDLVYTATAEEGPPGPEGNVIRLYHRRLTEPTARVIPGAEYAWSPRFSPDGTWVAFYARADQAIKKVALGGGSPVTIANTPWISWGANLSWSETGHILFADYFGPVRRVPVSGGEPEIVVPRRALRAGENGTETPVALPGEAGILFKPRGAGAPLLDLIPFSPEIVSLC